MLIREAFWGLNHPACDEHLVAHKLRCSPNYLPEMDYVAEADGKLVGHIMYSLAKIVDGQGGEHAVLNFGPLSVLPACKNRGVGKALMHYSIQQAKTTGYPAIVFFGHPDYYPRFGFKRGADFGLETMEGKTFDAFMAMELHENALQDITGRYYEDDAFFSLTKPEQEAFEKQFSHKEKVELAPITVILEKLSPIARSSVEKLGWQHLCMFTQRSQREIAALPGMDAEAVETIRAVMNAHGYIWGEPVR